MSALTSLGHQTLLKGVLSVKKVLLLLSVSAIFVLVFAPIAAAQGTDTTAAVTISAASSVSPSAASASVSVTTTAGFAKTGGPTYIPAVASAAALALILGGLVALRLVTRHGAS